MLRPLGSDAHRIVNQKRRTVLLGATRLIGNVVKELSRGHTHHWVCPSTSLAWQLKAERAVGAYPRNLTIDGLHLSL